VEQCDYLFSIPNIYPYSGLDVHTMDLFFLCRVKGTQEAKAMDDAESLAWIPWEQIMPQEFGLLSVRKGIIRLKMMWTNKK
jgi:hypothetical protein